MGIDVKKKIFAHIQKFQALLSEHSEFKCLEFYKRQKLFLAKAHRAAEASPSHRATAHEIRKIYFWLAALTSASFGPIMRL